MKSIKEKAEEYAREFVEPFVLYYTKDEVRQFEAQHEDSFEAGANYVLSVLNDAAYKEDWITNPKDGIRRFFEIYRQLKK